MKREFKIYISWLLLITFFLNYAVSFFLFEISIQINRNSIEKYFTIADESRLLILKISNTSSIVRKGNSEIIVEGRYYDVKKEIKINDITYFYCLHDEKEDNLNKAFDEILFKNLDVPGQGQKGHSIDVSKHLIKDFFHEKPFTFIHALYFGLLSTMNIESSLSNYFSDIITPPPQSKI